jgi:hypothetical protein
MVRGVLLARVPFGEVDDLVEDVFMRALRRLSMLRQTASFGAWLVQERSPEFESLRIRQRKVAPMGQFPWASAISTACGRIGR